MKRLRGVLVLVLGLILVGSLVSLFFVDFVDSQSGGDSSGESVALFTGSERIYLGDGLGKVRDVLTKNDLPSVLTDGLFYGNVETQTTQVIDLGRYPRLTFEKQPTSLNEPNHGIKLSTSTFDHFYNASVTFSRAVDFTAPNSQRDAINLFGREFLVLPLTDNTRLILLRDGKKLELDSDDAIGDIVVNGELYTIELISASDTSATIGVTDEQGVMNSKEVAEAQTKKINGLSVTLNHADESNLRLSVSISVGSERVEFRDWTEVLLGEGFEAIEGTEVRFEGSVNNMNKLTIMVAAPDSDNDAIMPGEAFIDPVFGSFKVDFAGMSSPKDSMSREEIKILPVGDDKLEVVFTEHRGYEKNFVWAYSSSSDSYLGQEYPSKEMWVVEDQYLRYQHYTILGDEGYLLKLSSVNNVTIGYSSDKAKFTDVFTGDVYEVVWYQEGEGNLNIGGKSYTVTLEGDSSLATEAYIVRIDNPDSEDNEMIVYPSIKTSNGARVMFYSPFFSFIPEDLEIIKFKNGLDYINMDISEAILGQTYEFSVGNLNYEYVVYYGGGFEDPKMMQLFLLDVDGNRIDDAALVILEEEDDMGEINSMIVKVEPGNSGDDGIGVLEVERTWNEDDSDGEYTNPDNTHILEEVDYWGSWIRTDSSDSDQKSVMISYPDEQVNALVYVSEVKDCSGSKFNWVKYSNVDGKLGVYYSAVGIEEVDIDLHSYTASAGSAQNCEIVSKTCDEYSCSVVTDCDYPSEFEGINGFSFSIKDSNGCDNYWGEIIKNVDGCSKISREVVNKIVELRAQDKFVQTTEGRRIYIGEYFVTSAGDGQIFELMNIDATDVYNAKLVLRDAMTLELIDVELVGDSYDLVGDILLSDGSFAEIYLTAPLENIDYVREKPYSVIDTYYCYETMNVEFEEGWNLVNTPLSVNLFESEETLTNSDIRAMYLYDSFNNEYLRYYPNREEERIGEYFERMEEVNFISSYFHSSIWVYSDIAQDIELQFLSNEGVSSLDINEVIFNTGWNFLSVTPQLLGKSLNDIKGNCDIEKAAFWGAEYQNWDVASGVDYDNEFSSESLWKGFVVKVSEDCNMGEVIVLPPEFPDNCADLSSEVRDLINVPHPNADDGNRYILKRGEIGNYRDSFVIPDSVCDGGMILELASINNATTGFSNDIISFRDVISRDVIDTTFTSEGVGRISRCGKSFDVTLSGDSNKATDEFEVTLFWSGVEDDLSSCVE